MQNCSPCNYYGANLVLCVHICKGNEFNLIRQIGLMHKEDNYNIGITFNCEQEYKCSCDSIYMTLIGF